MAAGLSYGQLLDSFTGTGALNANGWTSHNGNAGQLQILNTASDTGNSLSYNGLAASAGNRIAIVSGNNEDVNKASAETMTSVAYYSLLLKVDNTDGLHPNTVPGDYFFSSTSVASATTTSFHGRLYIRQGSTPNTVNFGVLNTSGGTAAPSFLSTDYAVGTTYFAVIKYDIASNTASLWINPTPGAAEPTAGATNATGTTAAPASIVGLVVRQGGNTTTGTGNVQLDEFRIGSTWAAVTPAGVAGVEESAIAGLKVFPNPLKGNVLNITSDANATKTVAIYDVLGKQVVNTTTANTSINVSSLTSGVYIVKITEEGKTATKKLVVQ